MREIPQMIEVLQAVLAGKPVEFKGVGEDHSEWREVSYPTWQFDSYDYRVKPEPPKPREIWIRECPDIQNTIVADSRTLATQAVCHMCKVTHFREVLDAPSVSNGNEVRNSLL